MIIKISSFLLLLQCTAMARPSPTRESIQKDSTVGISGGEQVQRSSFHETSSSSSHRDKNESLQKLSSESHQMSGDSFHVVVEQYQGENENAQKTDVPGKKFKSRPVRSILTLPQDSLSEFKTSSFQQMNSQFGQQRTVAISGNSGQFGQFGQQKYQTFQQSQPLVWSFQSSGREVNGEGSGIVQQSYPDGNTKISSMKWSSQGTSPGTSSYTFSRQVSTSGDTGSDILSSPFGELGKVFGDFDYNNGAKTVDQNQQFRDLNSFPSNLDIFGTISTGKTRFQTSKTTPVIQISQPNGIVQTDFDFNHIFDMLKQPRDQQFGKTVQVTQHRSIQSEQPLKSMTKSDQRVQHIADQLNELNRVFELYTRGSKQLASEGHIPRSTELETGSLSDKFQKQYNPISFGGGMSTKYKSIGLEHTPESIITVTNHHTEVQNMQPQDYMHTFTTLDGLNPGFDWSPKQTNELGLKKNLVDQDISKFGNLDSFDVNKSYNLPTESQHLDQPYNIYNKGTVDQSKQTIQHTSLYKPTQYIYGINQDFENRKDTKGLGRQEIQSNQKSDVSTQNVYGLNQDFENHLKDTKGLGFEGSQSNQIIHNTAKYKPIQDIYGLNQELNSQLNDAKVFEIRDEQRKNKLIDSLNLLGTYNQQASKGMLQQDSNQPYVIKRTTTHQSSNTAESAEHKSRLRSEHLQYSKQPVDVLSTHTEESDHHSESSNHTEHQSSHSNVQVGSENQPYKVVRTQTNHKETKVEKSSKSEKRSTRMVTVQRPEKLVVEI